MRKENITLRALKRYGGFNKKYFPLQFFHILFERFSPYFNLWMSAEIVTALYEGHEMREIFMLIAITLFGNLLVHAMGALLGRWVSLEFKRLCDNEAAVFNQKTVSLDYSKLEDPKIRMLRRKIKENAFINGYGVDCMRRSVEGMLRSGISLMFAGILFAEMLIRIVSASFEWLTWILLALMLIFTALAILAKKAVQKKEAEVFERVNDLMLKENQLGRGHSLNGMDARVYNQQPILTRLEMKMNQEHLAMFSWARWRTWLLSTPHIFLSKIPEICAYAIVCFYCARNIFPIGSVIKYVGYLYQFSMEILSIFYFVAELKNNERFLVPYLEYLNLPNDMYQGSLAVEKRSDKKYDIEFRNVSFKYAGSENYALKNVNLTFKVGERLAVVGMNGSGKTTFIKLMCRLYDPTEGEIYMNDFNVRKYDYRQYLDLFSVVFQDYSLLALPLGNNVSSAASWDGEKAERCLQEVGFGERYNEMAKGLETPIYKNFDDEGVNVSGGEAQKIALARALYKDAPFIILDEPTAALDPIAEAEIYAKFDEIVGDKTAIYISHRLSSCRFCDKIAVFDNGEIVQVGSHEELLSDENGKYYELWTAQAQYYTK